MPESIHQGAPQDASLVNVLLSLADGLLKMDTTMQAFMQHTSKRFDRIEKRLETLEVERQQPSHAAAMNYFADLGKRRAPSPTRCVAGDATERIDRSPLRRETSFDTTGGELHEALNVLTSKLSKLQQQRQHNIPSSTTKSVATSHAETEDISSGATRSTAPESTDWCASSTAATTMVAASSTEVGGESGQWTPTNYSSHNAPRSSPPPKAHSPAVRMVSANLNSNAHRTQPPPLPPKLMERGASGSPIVISQPRTEVYLPKSSVGWGERNHSHEDVSNDALLHIAIKPTPRVVSSPSNKSPGSPILAAVTAQQHSVVRGNHHVAASYVAPKPEETKAVERWLSTLSSSDDGFRNETFMVSRSTQ